MQLAHRDGPWLIPCTLALWMVGVILGLDDRGNVFRGSDPAAPTWGAWGLVVGVLGIWQWRRFLIRDDFTRPTHDSSDDLLWLCGTLGAIGLYLIIVPGSKLLPPNTTMCVLCGLAGAKLLYAGMTRRIGTTFHCSKCNYEIRDTSLPRRCPECSAIWARKLSRGRIERSVKLIGVGCLLLFVLTLAPLPRIGFAKAFLLRQMTTAWILSQAQSSLLQQTTFDSSLWGELSRRKLTEAQATPLAEIVLQQSWDGKLRDYQAMAWLEELVFSGQAATTVTDAYFSKALQFQLFAPPSAMVNQPIPIGVQALEFLRLRRDRIAIYLDSVWLEGDSVQIATATGWELLSDAMESQVGPIAPISIPRTPAAQALYQQNLPPSSPPKMIPQSDILGTVGTARVDTPGTVAFRGRIWIAIVPSGAAPTLAPANLAGQSSSGGKSPFLKMYDLSDSVLIRKKR